MLPIAVSPLGLRNVTDAVSLLLHYPIGGREYLGIIVDGHFLLEVILVVVIVSLMLTKSYRPERPLTEKEIDQLCDEWQPERLFPPPPEKQVEPEVPVMESAAGPRTVIKGESVLNLSSSNALGLVGNEHVNEAAIAALNRYGVGSCGPRGFYGTIDVHMDLEEKVASYTDTEDCILYSYGLATAASTIPAFCKRGDLIIADEGVHWGIQNGLALSRSTVRYFRHNDLADLEARLREVRNEDRRHKKALNRRFIVVEAIYQNSGQVAPLEEIVRLKKEYRFRIMLDESISFGVLGKTGRGLREQVGIDSRTIDITIVAMGNAIASVGGFCCGDSEMVNHQRLSGPGYCFSASLPPFLVSAAIAALSEMESRPELREKLASNVAAFRAEVAKVPGLAVIGDGHSPLVYLHLSKSRGSYAADVRSLQTIADKMLMEKKVLMVVSKRSTLDRCRLAPGLKVMVSAGHTEKELVKAAKGLREVTEALLAGKNCVSG